MTMPTTAGASAATTPTGSGGDAGAGAVGGLRVRCGEGSRRRGGRLNGRGTASTPGSAPTVTSVAPRRGDAPGPSVLAGLGRRCRRATCRWWSRHRRCRPSRLHAQLGVHGRHGGVVDGEDRGRGPAEHVAPGCERHPSAGVEAADHAELGDRRVVPGRRASRWRRRRVAAAHQHLGPGAQAQRGEGRGPGNLASVEDQHGIGGPGVRHARRSRRARPGPRRDRLRWPPGGRPRAPRRPGARRRRRGTARLGTSGCVLPTRAVCDTPRTLGACLNPSSRRSASASSTCSSGWCRGRAGGHRRGGEAGRVRRRPGGAGGRARPQGRPRPSWRWARTCGACAGCRPSWPAAGLERGRLLRVAHRAVSEYAQGVPEEMRQARLHPQLPPEGKPAWCFYPMSKRRATRARTGSRAAPTTSARS